MRIVSGKLKGRHIPVRKNFPSRPTTDFAKENLFNILNNHFDLEGIKVLDLFGGTGSISYEFASRGAVVTCVEMEYRSFRFIRDTAIDLRIDKLRVVRADALRYIEKAPEKYAIIFADPPYQMAGIERIPDLILQCNILDQEGWFILEHADQKNFSEHPCLLDSRSYGSVNFSIFTSK